jgi:hypothetical protein
MSNFNVVNTPVTTQQELNDAFDELLVSNTGSIITTDESAVLCNSFDTSVVIDGLVSANDIAIILGDVPAATADTLQVNSQGVIDGGIDMATNYNSVINAGDIFGEYTSAIQVNTSLGNLINNSGILSAETGIYLYNNTGNNTIENSGTLEGTEGPAIESYASPQGSGTGITIVNSGLMTNSYTNPTSPFGGVLYFNDSVSSTSSIDNSGTITGAGSVIQSYADMLNISNSGTIHGGLNSVSQVLIENSGLWQAGTDVSGGLDGLLLQGGGQITNLGNIDAAISLLTGSSTLKNSGSITGDITFSGAGSVLRNHHEIYGNVTMGNLDTLVNTGTIHGDVYLGASATINDSRGEITDAIFAGGNDTFVYSGLFGRETINNFVAAGATNDTIQFAANDFGSFGSVMSSTKQIGADSVITLDAGDSITLVGVAKSSLVATDFKFT